MDKVMKAEIEKILEELISQGWFGKTKDNQLFDNPIQVNEAINQSSSSLTALIIKWLEGKKERMKQVIRNRDIEFRTINDESEIFKIPIELSKEYLEYISQALITELIGEVR